MGAGIVTTIEDEIAAIRRLCDAGRLVEASREAQRVAGNNPRDATALATLGLVHFYAGRPSEAVGVLMRAIALRPGIANHHLWAGLSLERLGRDGEAMAAYRSAIGIDPRQADALERLGNILRVHERQAEALECFARAAAIAPDTIRGRMCRFKALQQAGRRDETETLLRETVAMFPNDAETKRSLASVLREQGRFAEAIPLLEDATEGAPAEAAAAYFDLVGAKRLTADDGWMVEQMMLLLEYPALPEQARQWVLFALGKACDDLGDYASAMKHYDAGNALVARRRPFDRAHFGASVQRVIDSSDPALFSTRPVAGSASRLPVLVVGMPRSGTTLVEQILSCHRGVAAGDELPFWNDAAEALARTGGSGIEENVSRAAHAYEALLREIGPDALRVTDKTPGNFLWLGLFNLAFPQAKIIHCRRHPIDTCLSNYFINYNAPMAYTYDKGHLAFYYRTYTHLMAHWRAVLPAGIMLDVDYEALVADPHTVTRRMIDFLDLDWDEACLRPQDNGRTVRTASQWQVRQPTHRGSVDRWRRYEPWLGELRDLLVAEASDPVRPSSDHPAIVEWRRLRDAERVDEAIGALQSALVAEPADAVLWNELGAAFLAADRLADARACLERAIGLNPRFGIARSNLGAVLERQGDAGAAMSQLRRAVALDPDLGAAHSRLGNLLHAQGEREEAMACFRRARACLDRPADQELEAAKLLRLDGRQGEAEATLRRIVSIDPGNALAHAMLGDTLGETGRFEEAVSALEQAVRLEPDRVGALYNMTIFQRIGANNERLVATMEEMAERPGRSSFERSLLHFALGKAWDDLGDPARAMTHFEAGNAIEHARTPFDRGAFALTVDRLIENPTGPISQIGPSHDRELPVLVLGLPRAGSALVEQVLAAHPAVARGGELTFWTDAANARFASSDLGRDYLACLRRLAPDALRVTDKNPFNFLSIGAVHAALPAARFVHCRRDPVDTCLSIFTTRFATPQPFAYDRVDLVFFYGQYRRVMAHWRATIPPDRLLEVDYEAITANPEAETRRLIEFCGLQWDEACLRPERNDRPISTASLWQARQPIHTGSVERWRRYEPWLGALRALLGAHR